VAPSVPAANNLDSGASCAFGAAGDLSNVVDPLLGALADNGGPTATHALLTSSPAIDAADSSGCPPPEPTNAVCYDRWTAMATVLRSATSAHSRLRRRPISASAKAIRPTAWICTIH